MNTFKAKESRKRYKKRKELIRFNKRCDVWKINHKAWLTKEAMERDIQYVNDKMAKAKTEKGPPYKMGGVIEYIPEKSYTSL